MITQDNISANTPMGGALVAGGATFRVWAPRATAVYLNGTFGGQRFNTQTPDRLLVNNGTGYWTGFQAGAQEGDLYQIYVTGTGSSGNKRDPYARELAMDAPFPASSSILRNANAYPWHDASFVTPDFSNMIVYQIHIGTYAISTPGVAATFLDVIGKIPYLVSLGINVLQPLPVDEMEDNPNMGYSGADLFSPDFPYVVTDPTALAGYVTAINGLLQDKGQAPIAAADIQSGHAQLQCLVDLCHVYGIAVTFDVVYNHAGEFSIDNVLDDNCIYYFDRMPDVNNNNDSLYFTDQDRGTGGLSFALWNNGVSQFLIDNAAYYLNELHADGFRYDEISSLLSMNKDSGWTFCCNLTDTLRYIHPRLLQNAEYWPGEFGDYPQPWTSIVTPVASGGAGFDVVQHDALRAAVRGVLQSAAAGQQAAVSMERLAAGLYPSGFSHGWQAVTCVENHDRVYVGRDPRIPALSDSSNHRSWYARSRSRFATGMLLTAPGIPQLFMGQEFLEDKQWNEVPSGADLIWWGGLAAGADAAMVNHLRFTQDLIRLRWNQPALRGDNVNAFHIHDSNRVIAFQRWLEGAGQDVIVVATLAEATWYNYAIGFPYGGQWNEVFNSDVYDNWVNPIVAGNGGGIDASGPPMHGFPASAAITIPANGFVVFAQA
ncbi:MAG: alpha amylase C-terminal domain-containing protein [Terracidiphilus sp.]|jgi:1,4-alpha-glucan branching enzyme